MGKGHVHLIVVGACGIVASAAIFAIVQRLAGLRAEAHFLQIADQRLSAVKTNVSGALDPIAILTSSVEAAGDGGASRRAFSTLVAPVLANHRYLQAVEWIPRVDRQMRSKYERLARADGMEGFTFKESGSNGLVVAGQRDQYFPVFYVEPLAGNELAVGYDLASNPVRLAALVQAQDTGRLAATARVKLVQEKADQWGTLVFAPAYSRPEPVTVAGRRKNLLGFGLSVLRIGDLISGAGFEPQKRGAAPLVDIYLFDMSAAASERQLYPRNPATTPELLTRGLHTEDRFEVGGRVWLLLATPGAGFTDRPSSASSFLVLAFGLLLTGLYLRYLKVKVEQAARIAKAADEVRCAQAELKQTNEMLEAVIRCSPLAVVTLDLEERITMWNPAAESMYGWTKEEVLGRHLPSVFSQDNRDEVLRVQNRILREGDATGCESVRLTKQGSPITVSVSGAPLHNAVGKRSGVVYLVMDITERKLLERQLAQSQRLESVGQLAAGIAHEINTPIQYVGDNLRFIRDSFEARTAVIAQYEQLRRAAEAGNVPAAMLVALAQAIEDADMEYLNQEIPKAAAQSLDGVERVATIVGAMKEFAHPGRKEKAAADLNKALENTLIVARSELKYVADVETDLGELPPVICRIGEMNQVFLNLLINAAHAIADVVRDSGGKGKITVRTRLAGTQAVISISDTGCGIPAEIRDRVFDPFFTTKPVGLGTGQGLAIARSIVVEKHGGSLTFEPNGTQGTTFRISLPLASLPATAVKG